MREYVDGELLGGTQEPVLILKIGRGAEIADEFPSAFPVWNHNPLGGCIDRLEGLVRHLE